jgi:hypothetical protein
MLVEAIAFAGMTGPAAGVAFVAIELGVPAHPVNRRGSKRQGTVQKEIRRRERSAFIRYSGGS